MIRPTVLIGLLLSSTSAGRRQYQTGCVSRGQQVSEKNSSSAPFLKGGTQTYASDAAAVSAHDPKPKEWLSGLVAGWRLSSPGRSRNYPQSTLRQRPVVGKYATSPR